MRRNRIYFVVVFLVASLLAATRSLGETLDRAPATDRVPVREVPPPRKVASVANERSYGRTKVVRGSRRQNDSMQIRFGALVGMTSATDSAIGGQARSNVLLGLTGDFREMKYFGAEIDGFYGLPTTKDDTRAEILGITGMLKGQLPISLGSIRLVPKAGLGYGITKISDTFSQEGFEDSEKTNLQGVWAMVGLDFEFLSDFLIGLDFARTIDAKGKLEATGLDPEDSGQVDLIGNSAERIRVGLFYRVAPHVVLGAQYIRRSFKYTVNAVDGGLDFNPIHNQVMGLIMYEL